MTEINTVLRDEHPSTVTGEGALVSSDEVHNSLEGYNEVYELNGGWYAYRETSGGTSLSGPFPSEEAARQSIEDDVQFTRDFWEEKVTWKDNGDKTTGPGDAEWKIIRAGGWHYAILPMPEDEGMWSLGHGGRPFTFQTHSGETIESNNVWSQGQIPPEYRDRLPDNADLIPQPVEPTIDVEPEPES